MSDAARARALGALALLAALVAGGLDGGVDPRVSGVLGAALGGLALVAFPRAPPADRAVRAAVLTLLIVLCVPRLPCPDALRRVLAPGQADALARLGADGDAAAVLAWLGALARADVDAALGMAPPWPPPALAPAQPGVATYAIDTARWASTAGLVAAMIACGHAGAVLARTRRGPRLAAAAIVIAGIGQTLFGLAHRTDGTTGLGAKVHYLGSATGTFVHRGQFAAFLLLALGAAWGLAAMQFPLLPEEVRRHAKHRRRSSQPPGVLEASGDKLPRLALVCFAAALLGLGLVAAQSRAALLAGAGAACGLAMWGWHRRAERWHAGLVGAAAAIGVVLSVASLGLRGAFGRFAGLLGSGDASAVSRARLWRESLAALRDAPFLGHGLGGWRNAWGVHERGPHLYTFSHAHAEWLEWAVDTGVVGTAALAALAWVSWRRVGRSLGAAPTGPEAGLGVGLGFGVLAVAGMGLTDFPLRAPGVALPWAFMVGILVGRWGGGAHPPATPPGPAARPWHVAAAGILALVTGIDTARAAWADPGNRSQRVGEVHPAWRQADTLPHAQALTRAEEAVRAAPLDPWAHAALGRARTRDAAEAWRRRAPDAERRVHRAEEAWTRALALRGGSAPRDPRLALARAESLEALAAAGFMPDALRSRSVDLAARALALDPWRATDAFRVASHAGAAGLRRVAEAAPASAGRPRARVLTAYGRALEARAALEPEARDAALDAYTSARRADPRYAPAAFGAGELLRRAGDAPAAADALREAVSGEELAPAMEGWAHLHLADPTRAIARFESALRGDPRHRWALEGLIEAELAVGDAADAVRALRRRLALDPQDRRLQERLEALRNESGMRHHTP